MKHHSELRPGGADEDPDLDRLRRVHVDDGAFERLYREFYPRLYDFVMRIVASPGDAEEIINDTMFVVWRNSDEFAARSRVSTWIFGIAYKKALKRLQGNRRLAAREVSLEIDPVDFRDPADTLSDRALLDAIRVAVARLPLAQRSIVYLAFFYDYSYAEIAEIVDCPVNTVKTRMFYARERLRPVLDLALAREQQHGQS